MIFPEKHELDAAILFYVRGSRRGNVDPERCTAMAAVIRDFFNDLQTRQFNSPQNHEAATCRAECPPPERPALEWSQRARVVKLFRSGNSILDIDNATGFGADVVVEIIREAMNAE